jgi:hypothetical protein
MHQIRVGYGNLISDLKVEVVWDVDMISEYY